jgi:GNAT superfamily N-acetyltransferase
VGSRLTVRPYHAARDAAALRACIVEHQEFHRGLEPSWPEGATIVDAYVAYLETQCRSHDGRLLVAERDGEVLGFACVVAATRGDSPDDPATFAWLHDIFVRAAHRGAGIGAALLAEAEAFARSHGARLLRLGVLDRNGDARAFYRGHGFRDYVRIVTKDL